MNSKSVVRRATPRLRITTWLDAKCEKCQQIFRVPPSLAAGEKRQRFCSMSCAGVAREEARNR